MPISNEFSFPKSETKTFDVLPSDAYEVTIKDIQDKTSYFKNEDGTDKQVFDFTFQIEDEPHKGRLVWKEAAPYVKPGGEKKASTLYTIIAAVMGRELTKEECANFGAKELNALIGKNLRVVLSQKTSGSGKVYNNVVSVLPSKMKPTGDGISF